MAVCIFCLRHEGNLTTCTYDMHHELDVTATPKPKAPTKKVDRKLCLHCGLHPKNPAFAASECKHEFQTEDK